MENNELGDAEITHEGRRGQGAAALALLFAAVAALAAADLTSDIGEGASVRHMVTEAILLLTGLLGLALMVRRLVRLSRQAEGLRRQARELSEQLEVRTAEATRWRREAHAVLEGLGVAIDRQFDRWRLTPAEREVGLLLLKGLSHKEVAAIRGVSSATARQQARSMYKKGGLSGRNDLAAFFLEDLLLPPRPRAKAT